ncbi:MAG TPA: carboxypeptidase regulatory-like domain-containing protein [Terriglobia bacterium]|nr:carboxypeptidase regulatory-like domain-containing protein [Terriglobia bacterium]
MKTRTSIMNIKSFASALALTLLTALAPPAGAQLASSTNLTGTVTDTSGAVVPGANVKAVNTATQIAYNALTNGAGIYNILYIPVGTYRLSVTARGFDTAVHTNIIVENNQTARTDFVLHVGSVQTSVTVSSAPPPIATDDATIGQTITTTDIAQLPVNGQDPLKLATINSSVMLNADNAQGNPPGERFQGAGTRQIQNDVTLDGVTLMNALYMTVNFRPDPAAVQEVNVLTGTYSAQYGNYLGVHINEVTKGGTNQLHGSFSENFGNTALNANTFDFSAVPIAKEPYHFNQYNAELGGPVVIPHLYNGKDKTFFMFDYQGLRNDQTPTDTYTVMTPLMRQGNFTELLPKTTLTDIYNPSCVSGNIIAPTCISPAAQQFLKVIPAPNVPSSSTASGFALVNNLVVPTESKSNFNQYLTRIDENVNNKTRLSFRYGYQSGAPFLGAAFPNDATYSPNTQSNFVVDYTQIISPAIINDFHIGRNRFDTTFASAYYEVPSTDATAQALDGAIGGNGAFAYMPANPGIPVISISGYTGAGNGGTNWFQGDTAWVSSDAVSVFHGAHSIVTGIDLDRFLTTRKAVNDPQGLFSFTGTISSPGSAAGAPADFMLGLPQVVDTPAPEVNGSGQQWRDGFYFEDKWAATSKLTLNLGLRYELDTVPVSPTGYATILNATETALVPTNVPAPNYPLTKPWRLGWAPRVGFAYRVTKDWVVRGGFGIFYNPNQTNSYTLLDTNPPMSSAAVFNTSPSAELSFPNPSGGGSAAKPAANTVSVVTLNAYMPPATMNQWSLDVERSLWSNAGLDVQYIGSHTYHLDTSWYSNEPQPGVKAFVAADRPNQSFGSIRDLSDQAWSNYDALNAILTQRFHHGLAMTMSYTWSHDLDISQDSNDGGAPMDPYNWALDYGNSTLSVPQRFVATVVYQLPFFTGSKGLVRALAAGWNADSILTIQSGTPFNVVVAGDPANTSRTGVERPNLIGTPINECGARLVACITNASQAFAQPAAGTYGNMARDMLYGPGFADLDFALDKNFKIGERFNFQLRCEAFNILNHPTFGVPGATFGSSTFGNITTLAGTNPTRVIQFMGRLTF